MRATLSVEQSEHEPVRRPCTLLGECQIEEGTLADYKLLSAYHYRDTRHVVPATHQVYRAVHRREGAPTRVVGVVVYAAPSLNLGIRNRIFGNRYRIGGSPGHNQRAARRTNEEVELIIRVVVHPTFRGTGLGQRLIADTLRKRPYRYIEMSAAMGSINPFAQRAGMMQIQQSTPKNTARVLGVLRSIGITGDQVGNVRAIKSALERAREHVRTHVEGELMRYAQRWIKSRTSRDATVTLDEAIARVAANCLLPAMYYIYENTRARKTP